MKNNNEMITFIKSYEGKNELECSIKNDVLQRINDWMHYSHANINDEYICKQIVYFNRYIKFSELIS